MARLANPEIPTLSSAAAAILSRAAPRVLASGTSFLASLPYPLSALARESAEQWRLHDAVALACLQTGDVAGARRAVGALAGRFGADNERIQALAGMVDEVAAGDDRAAVQQVLDHYAATVEADPTNLV